MYKIVVQVDKLTQEVIFKFNCMTVAAVGSHE